MRGEQIHSTQGRGNCGGSPPLARGTVSRAYCRLHLQRITPACAGNSGKSAPTNSAARDHPRLRGEQWCSSLPHTVRTGSPPLARGTETCVSQRNTSYGITPACAGNRYLRGLLASSFQDHPRLRGEQLGYDMQGNIGQGSPPLARGTDARKWSLLSRRGITPACAGNSLSAPMKSLGAEDHPRLRGEQAVCAAYVYNDIGSPPLARGTGYHARPS